MDTRGHIVVGGEALIDLVRHDGADQLAVRHGGGPYTTARTLGRLHCPTTFLGALSTDTFGLDLARQLHADGVRPAPGLTTVLPTTLAVAELDAGGSATYGFYTEGTSVASITPEAALAALPADVDALHVGTLGLVVEPLAAAMRAVVERVSGQTLVMADLNCRPAAIADRDAYVRSLAPTLRRCDVVKASVEDLAWLMPDRAPEDAARDLLGRGPATVLVTDGARGACAVLAESTVTVASPPASVIDTIGAGDAFGGGFLAWWNRNHLGRAVTRDERALEAALDFACLVAAKTCERPGAWPPTLAELGPAGQEDRAWRGMNGP